MHVCESYIFVMMKTGKQQFIQRLLIFQPISIFVVVQFFNLQRLMKNLFELVKLQIYHENCLKSETFLIIREFKIIQIIQIIDIIKIILTMR